MEGGTPIKARGLITLFVIVVIGFFVSSVFLKRVDPGNAGVIIDYWAGTKTGQPSYYGVEQGRYVLVTPWSQGFSEMSIRQNTLTMVQAQDEGIVKGDDAIQCNLKDRSPVRVDESLTWRPDPERIGELWNRLPSRDTGYIQDNIVRVAARSATTDACQTIDYDEAFGDRTKFEQALQQNLSAALASNNLILDALYVRNIHPGTPEMLKGQTTIVQAQQAATAASFKEAEAKNLAAARRAEAQGEADAIEKIAATVDSHPNYLTYQAQNKWNGILPSVTGGAVPMIQLPAPK